MEFKSAFEVQPRAEKLPRTTIKVEKQDKITKLYFPDNYIQLKGSKVFLAEVDMNDKDLLVLTEWKEGYPNKHVSVYNLGDNSINSAPIANKLAELFDIEEESFELQCGVITVEGTSLLVVSDVVTEEVEEDEINTL